MKKTICISAVFIVCFLSAASAGLFDDVLKGIGGIKAGEQSAGLDDSTIVSGLKESLSIGTEKSVKYVSQDNGYFGNEIIRILMPEKIQNVANVLKKVGFQKQVDEFVLSMNRAAEKAAPQAMSYFVDAIKGMTIADARGILNGGDTAATDYFRKKTGDRIYESFKPIVSSSMNEVGTTKAYKDMIGKYETIPFVDKQSVDLDHYVTNKALDGLFYMIGQEEKKIRTDPAARVTDILKTVFGK